MDKFLDGLPVELLGASDTSGLGYWVDGLPTFVDGAGGTGGGGGGGGSSGNALFLFIP
jgi:hypothetical protein